MPFFPRVLAAWTLVGCWIFVAGCTQPRQDAEEAVPDIVDFNFHVRPILSDRCFACHGPDANTREAGLRLDTPEGAFAALAEDTLRHAILPGDPGNSELIRRINLEDEDERMPPLESNLFLTDTEREILWRWIEQGAEWKTHWAFIPPEKTELPTYKQGDWAKNEIDAFVAARLDREGVAPNPAAAPEKWLRRVSFDQRHVRVAGSRKRPASGATRWRSPTAGGHWLHAGRGRAL